MNPTPTLYIVVPCYNEEEVLPETARRLSELMDSLISFGEVTPESRVLFVDDGSKDAVWLLGHTQNWRFSFYPARGVQQGSPDRHPVGGHDARERGMATGAGHPSLSR